MKDLSRRSLFGIVGTALAAPVIIRTPGLLMLPPLKRVHVLSLWNDERGPLYRSPVNLVNGRYEQMAIGELAGPGLIRGGAEVRYMRNLPTEWYAA